MGTAVEAGIQVADALDSARRIGLRQFAAAQEDELS
jgi:hypothetical protein